MDTEYKVSFHCYYGTNCIKHIQRLKLSDIPVWMNCYRFTHPCVKSISVKVWMDDMRV